VYAVNADQTVSVKPVKLGPVQGETTAVDSGIAPGATVVVDGADKLREGAKVELITREARNAPPSETQHKGDKPGRAAGESRRSKSGG
jgi:multidrug efflux system membrane fusion protein